MSTPGRDSFLTTPAQGLALAEAIREEVRVARLIEAMRPYLLSTHKPTVAIPTQRRRVLSEARWEQLVTAAAQSAHLARQRRIRAANRRHHQEGHL